MAGGMDETHEMHGGGICENWVVEMAVNSAIVLGGLAASTVGAIQGYQALVSFMVKFNLDEATALSINAVYEIVKASGSLAYQVGSASFDAIGSVGPSLGRAAGSFASVAMEVGPFVALGRYIGTEQSALADLQRIYNNLKNELTALQAFQGRITRSVSEKQQHLQGQLNYIKNNIDNTVSVTRSGFTGIKERICGTIDTIKKTGENAQEAIFNALSPYYPPPNIEFTLGGKRTKKSKKKSKNAK